MCECVCAKSGPTAYLPHEHAPRLAHRPRRTTARSPRRTCRPHRHTGLPSTPPTTRRHSNQRRDTGAGGSARYAWTAQGDYLTDLSLNDANHGPDHGLVPEAPQSRVAL
eukprot:4514898-Prymnesium_polylepis.1